MFCWLVLASLPDQALGASTSRFQIAGVPYVNLTEWARSKQFKPEWVVKNQTLRLRNADQNLLVTVHSKKIVLNDIGVWLAEPVVLRGSSFYVGAVDIPTTFEPLLLSGTLARKQKLRRICLDPGHGGKDPGNEEGKEQEKKYTLLLAQEVAGLLRAADFEVALTRNNDTFKEPAARPDWARQQKADLFVSLHYNAIGGSAAAVTQGVEIYCMTAAGATSTNARGQGREKRPSPSNRYDGQNVLLAYRVQRSLVKGMSLPDRGVRRARFAVLRNSTMPAILVEAGYMSHPAEGKKVYDRAHRRRVAKAIADGIIAYKHQVEK